MKKKFKMPKIPKAWKKTFTGKFKQVWTNIHKGTKVELQKDLGDWLVVVVDKTKTPPYQRERSKKFSFDKKVAMFYAKDWMKKHPRG